MHAHSVTVCQRESGVRCSFVCDDRERSGLGRCLASVAMSSRACRRGGPAGARSLDDAIRALEGVVAVRPSVGPALELLKKERRGLK